MNFTNNPQQFLQIEGQRIAKYYTTNKKKLVGFNTKQDFIDWYLQELARSEHKCHYCNTSILSIRQLINTGVINGRKVSGGGIRGANFELDRKDPMGDYHEQNCVLSCYYCNNDKSNTFDYHTFLNIIGPAKMLAWNTLIKALPKT